MACVEVNSHLKSFERVHNYPFVNDSLLFATNYYRWIKSKNTMLDETLSRVEETLQTIKDKAEPFAAEKFHYFDQTVCDQLEKLEKLCPIILEPSSEIKGIPANIYHGRIEPSLNHVLQPVTETLKLVNRTTFMAAYMLSSTVSYVLPPLPIPVETTKNLLNKTEQLLDKYLPAQEGETSSDCRDSNEIICSKIKRLSKKTQNRLYKKMITEIETFKKVSVEKLNKIHHVIQEIRQRKSSVCKEVESEIKEDPLYRQLIRDGLYYTDCLQNVIVSTSRSVPRIFCTNTISVMDLLNEKLFDIRNTILDCSSQTIVSEKRLNQAADSIDFVRYWIERATDNLKEYYNRFQMKSNLNHPEEEDLPESCDTELSTSNDEEENDIE